MGKNNKNAASAAKAAAQQAAPETKTTEQKDTKSQVAVIQLGDLDKLAQQRALVGMDPNHMEDLIGRLDDRFYKDKEAAVKYNVDQSTVDTINAITARAMIALLANEVEIAQTPFAVRMRMSSLEALKEAGEAMHINIDTKVLPAPKDGIIEVPSTAIKPSAEAKKGLAEERKIAEQKVQLDPTKIENEEDLKKSLSTILVKGNGGDNLYDKISMAIDFYKAYCGIQANKSEKPEEAKAELASKSRDTLLSEIAHLLGKCTFTLSNVSKFMFEQTERTKSPVVAFCMLREASLNKKTGNPQIEDQLVADIVKVLVRWHADTEIAASNEVIAGFERDIETLKKDEAKNKKGIETGYKKIEAAKKHIEDVERVVTYVNIPDRSTVDDFKKNYTDNTAEGFKLARMIGSKIMSNYYHGVKPSEVKPDNLLHNLQQYVGVITNMFLPPLSRLSDYSEANIVELEKVTPQEKSEKNA